MAVYKKVPGCKTVNISTLEFDTKPTKGLVQPGHFRRHSHPVGQHRGGVQRVLDLRHRRGGNRPRRQAVPVHDRRRDGWRVGPGGLGRDQPRGTYFLPRAVARTSRCVSRIARSATRCMRTPTVMCTSSLASPSRRRASRRAGSSSVRWPCARVARPPSLHKNENASVKVCKLLALQGYRLDFPARFVRFDGDAARSGKRSTPVEVGTYTSSEGVATRRVRRRFGRLVAGQPDGIGSARRLRLARRKNEGRLTATTRVLLLSTKLTIKVDFLLSRVPPAEPRHLCTCGTTPDSRPTCRRSSARTA